MELSPGFGVLGIKKPEQFSPKRLGLLDLRAGGTRREAGLLLNASPWLPVSYLF